MNNIEDYNKPYWYQSLKEKDIEKCFLFLDKYYQKMDPNIKNEFIKYQGEQKFESIKYGYLIYIYQLGRQNNRYPIANKELEKYLRTMSVRENSGVMVFSIFTSAYPDNNNHNSNNPGMFSCKYDCYYCPNEPGQPRSYLAQEPGVARAIENDYDPMKQIIARAAQYIGQGHPIDKCEIIIQGGTWDSYSYKYRMEFIRDIYYTFNVLMDIVFKKDVRDRLDMNEEIKINEKAACRVVGLTPETRPDQINKNSIKFLRAIGATRVQLGVQHLDDIILKYINRRCYKRHSIKAIRMLKDSGFKVDIHIMPDLPAPPIYTNKMHEIDRKMFEELNSNSDFKIDQLKIYPCMVTNHTKIKEWYESGQYKPYGEDKPMNIEEKIRYRKLSVEDKLKIRLDNPLYKNILDFYTKIHPSIRVNRIIRDIPTSIVCGGTKRSSMRSEIERDLETLDLLSNCIRYREAGNSRNTKRPNNIPVLKELCFAANGCIEYFLSFESDESNPILYSFLRLRLPRTNNDIFPELNGCALVRELHTYGKVIPCKENMKYYENNNIFMSQNNINKSQHKGYGKRLLERAESIAYEKGYTKVAVIAGVGVRNYYRNNGYNIDSIEGCYQIKSLNKNNYFFFIVFGIILAILGKYFIMYLNINL